jgi:hypothetical protein
LGAFLVQVVVGWPWGRGGGGNGVIGRVGGQ